MDAIIGLLGAVIGAIGAGGVAWWSQRNSARSHGRRAARVLLGETTALRARLSRACDEQEVLPDVGEILLMTWRDNKGLGELPFNEWRLVTARVHDLSTLTMTAQVVSRSGSSEDTIAAYESLSSLLLEIESVLVSASR